MGFAFLTKSLQAFLVLPGFALVAGRWCTRRAADRDLLAVAAVALLVSGGWWLAIVELVARRVPAVHRRLQTNSALELILGYNGLGRITGDETGSVGGGGGDGRRRLGHAELAPHVRRGLGRPDRLAAARRAGGRRDHVVPSGSQRMHRISTILWGGWLLVTWVVFSFSQGIIHQYYAVALAPAIGALVAMAVTLLWRHRAYVGLGALLGGSALYGATLLLKADYDVLGWIVLVVGVAGSITLGLGDLTPPRVRTALASALIAVTLLGPLSFSLETASRVTSGSLPSAGPSLGASSGPGAGTMPGGPGGATGLP